MLAGGSSDESEEHNEILDVTILPLDEWSLFQKAVDDKGNIYNVLFPTRESFSWKTFKFTKKYKFNAGERHLAEVSLYKSGPYCGAIGSIQFVRINMFGSRLYL